MMIDRRVQIWIAVAAGLVLVTLLLLAGNATASLSPPMTMASQRHAVPAAAQWSSPWVPIPRGQPMMFAHNLGEDPNNYVVELDFLDTDGGQGINRDGYGGLEVNGNWAGGHWQNLTANTIRVFRQPNDNAADQVRVLVWVPLATADFDSGWTDINQGQTFTFTHNVGITPTELGVGLWFSDTIRGIHHFGYGGLAVDGPRAMLGAHWQDLTTNTVQVVRHPDDTDVQQVRVVVVHGDPPDYDSGWQNIPAGNAVSFAHNLNWDPDMLLARGECYDPSGLRGIHKLFAGGNHDWFDGGQFQGSHLQNLTANTVAVFRQPDDEFCAQVRVRITKRSRQFYLPLVLRNS